jgi:amidohydrolase
VAGVSHACGHDVHTAVAAGLAASLTALKDTLPGRVRIVFQPAEEVIPSGGNALLSEGVLKDARAALALHCDPTRDVGTVGVRVGPLTSTADAFHIEVIGEAGHAARPHLARDAIAASAAVVQALYGLVSRRVSPVEPAVLTVGYIEGGVAENVLADRVRMGGNLRTVDEHTRLRLQRELREVAQASASIHGCAVEVQFKLGAPPIRNDKHLHGYVCDSANEVLGSQGVQVVADPSTGAEDFGFYSMATRIYMMRLGVHTPGKEVFHLHTPAFNPDERSIGYAMRIMGRALIRILSAPYEADAG